ncbi:MAG: hypothetical protein U0838_01540 [Chloroflexota bacterium]
MVLTAWGMSSSARIQAGQDSDWYVQTTGLVHIWGDARRLVGPVLWGSVLIGYLGWVMLVERSAPWRVGAPDPDILRDDARLAAVVALVAALIWSVFGQVLAAASRPNRVAPYPGWWVSIETPVFDIRLAVFLLASTVVVFSVARLTPVRAYLVGVGGARVSAAHAASLRAGAPQLTRRLPSPRRPTSGSLAGRSSLEVRVAHLRRTREATRWPVLHQKFAVHLTGPRSGDSGTPALQVRQCI